jgi:hypothetical protein
VYRISSKSVDERPFYSLNSLFKMAAALLENGGGLSLLRWMNSACVLLCVHRISSKSVNKCPFYSLSSIFKMAAAAILESKLSDL